MAYLKQKWHPFFSLRMSHIISFHQFSQLWPATIVHPGIAIFRRLANEDKFLQTKIMKIDGGGRGRVWLI